MKSSSFLILIPLALAGPLVLSQENNNVPSEDNSQISSVEADRGVRETPGQETRETEEQIRSRPTAEVVPEGWIDDFDYQAPLQAYLAGHHDQAAAAGDKTYLYLYADWLEPCREFRKTAERKNYAKLFGEHRIIMLDYGYFARTFNTKVRNLPILIRVHENGVVGPEIVHPMSRRVEHPAKAYNRVKNFLKQDS